MNIRILKTSLKILIRSKKRLFSFVVIYGILLSWMSLTLEPWRWDSIDFLSEAGFVLMAGALVATIYGFLLSFFRSTDIAILKCLGWNNNDIRTLIVGEIVFVTLLGLFSILEVAIHILGLLYYFLGTLIAGFPIVDFIIFPLPVIILAFGTIMVAQVPGILIATWRVLSVSPMRAFRAAK